MDELVRDSDNTTALLYLYDLFFNSYFTSILTLGTTSETIGSKTWHSATLLDLIEDVDKDKTQSSRNLKIFKRLEIEANYAPDVPFWIARNLSKHGFTQCFNKTRVMVGKTGIFAVVDNIINIKIFRHSIALIGNYKSAHHNAGHFGLFRYFWLVYKNFFATVFATGMELLVEGGIYQIWYKNAHMERLQMRSYAMFRALQRKNN